MTAAPPRLWHVTVQLCGEPAPTEQLGPALQSLCDRDPMNMAARYAADRAELQFWDEGPELGPVAVEAARLWQSSRADMGLPDWSLVGLEVLEQGPWRQQWRASPDVRPGSVDRLA